MKFEFAFRTYNSFIPNATLVLASNWIESRLDESYGAGINSVIVELCCKNTSPPKKTLEKMNENFEAWLGELPYYELTEKNTELRICYRAIKYTHDEVSRDSQVLSVKTFQQVISKSAQLIEEIPSLSNLKDFNSTKLARCENVGSCWTVHVRINYMEVHYDKRRRKSSKTEVTYS